HRKRGDRTRTGPQRIILSSKENRLHHYLGLDPTEVEAAYYADLETPETATAALEKQ
ncbi:hypothetical protein ABIB54_003300, partial [Frigoribacterium sp. UYMn621]